jgi:hypothetical protein
VFEGELYAGGNPRIFKFNGSSWTVSADNVSANVFSLQSYNGGLYAATNNTISELQVYDGTAWSLFKTFSGPDEARALGVHAGRLYASVDGPSAPQVYTYDGKDLILVRQLPAASDVIYAFEEFDGRLYTAAHVDPSSGVVFVTTPTAVSISGSDGSLGLETLQATGLNIQPSTDGSVCDQNTSCTSTNQVRFNYRDRAGRVGAFGPFAILSDPLLSAPTGYSPQDGAYVRDSAVTLAWIETTTQPTHGVQVDRDIDFAAPIDLDLTSEGLGATNFYNITTPPSLTQATTYYWRVRGANASGVRSEFSPTRTFVIDAVSPSTGLYRVQNSTNGLFEEQSFVNLNRGVTVQIEFQDTDSGLGLGGLLAHDRVGSWSFEGVSGATVTDRSGQGHAMIMSDSALRSAAGYRGRGLAFPNGAAHAVVSTPTVSSWNGATIMGWVRPQGDNTSYETMWASKQFRFYSKHDQGRVAFHYEPAAGQNGGCSFTTGQRHPLGAWLHVALVLHPSANRIYVDGVEEGSCNSAPSGATPEDTSFSIGGDVVSGIGGIDNYNGSIDEVKIFKRVLTREEIVAESHERGFSVEYSTTAGQSWSVAASTYGAGARLAHTGADASLGLETLSLEAAAFTESTHTVVCSGTDPCAATNQVRFFAPDRAGNIRSAGPFAVLVDTSVPLPVLTSLTPLTTETMYVTATATDSLSGLDAYNFEASTSSGFGFPVSSSGFIADSTFTFTGLLSASTYYVRVIARDAVLNVSTPSVVLTTSTFGSVFYSSFSATPAGALQDGLVSILGFTLNTKQGVSSGFTGVTVNRTGSSSDADVEDVRVYRDDGDQTFSAATDVNVGPAGIVFVDSQAVVNLPVSESLTVAHSTFFVVYKMAGDAAVGETVGGDIVSASDMRLTFPASAEGPFPTQSALIPITDGANNASFTRQDFAPLVEQAQPGVSDHPMLQMLVETDQGTSEISSMVFTLNGILPAFVSRVNVWRDAEPNGLFDPNLDEKLTDGSDAFSPTTKLSTVTFNPAVAPVSSRTITTSVRRYFVTVDLAATAPTDEQFSVEIASESAIYLTNFADVVTFASSGPIVSTTMTVVLDNTLTVTPLDNVPASFTQGEQYLVATASMTVDGAQTTFNSLTVNRTGTGLDSDIESVSVFKDGPPLGSFGGSLTDTFLASGTFSSQSATLGFAEQTLVAGTTIAYFVVYDVAGGANPGNTLGAQLGLSAVNVTNANTTLNAPFPFNTSNAPITETVNQLLVTNSQDVTVGNPRQGDEHFPMLRMDIASDAGDFLWLNLVVDKTGTAASTDVAKVNLFRDFDGDQSFDVLIDSRVTNDAQTFDSGGSVNLSLTTVQTVQASTQTYFVTVSLDPNAGPGGSIGLAIPTTGAFNLISPNTTNPDIQTFPVQTSTASINPFQNTVSLSSASIVPAGGAEPGDLNVGMMELRLNTDVSNARWIGLQVNQAGSALPADVDAVKVYFDFNDFGVWNSANVGNYQLISSSTQTFDGSGNVTLSFSTPPVLSPTPARFFVVADISTNAAPGNTLAVRASTGPFFNIEAPNFIDPNAIFTSDDLTIKAPPVTMFVQGLSSSPAQATQGDSNVVMLTLRTWTSAFDADWSGLTVTRTGTGSDSDVSSVKLYQDDGDGSLNVLVDTRLATNTFTGGTAALSFPAVEVTASTQVFFVTYDLSSVAQSGTDLGASIVAAGDVDIDTPPNSVDTGSFPVQSSTTAVRATESGLFMTVANLAPGKLKQGTTNQLLLSLALRTTQFALAWNNLTVRSSGTAVDSDIAAVNLWRDVDENGQIDESTDTRVTSGLNSFIGGIALLSLGSEEVGTTEQKYLLTVDVADFAEPGRTFFVTIESTADVSVSNPNFVVTPGPFPASSDSNTEFEKLAEDIAFTATDLAPTGVNQGSEVAFAKIEAYATRYRAVWTGMKITKFGSLSDLEIDNVSVYRDSDLSGTLTATDLFVGSAAFTSSSADVSFSSAQTVGPSTQTYFVAPNVALASTVGSTLRFGFNDPDFTVASPDDAASGLSFTNAGFATILDATTPSQPVVTTDGPFNSNFEQLHFVWSSNVSIGTISGAFYAVGTTVGGTELADWTALESDETDVIVKGLTLVSGTTYYVSVKSLANSLESPVGTSDPILMDFDPPQELDFKPVIQSNSGGSGFRISWIQLSTAGPSGILGYLVEYKNERNPVWINAKTGSASTVQSLGLKALKSAQGSDLYVMSVSTTQLIVNNNSVVVTGAQSGTISARVRAVSGAGLLSEAKSSDSAQVGPLPKDGISNASLYPNPFDSRSQSGKFYYELSQSADVTISTAFSAAKLRGLISRPGPQGEARAETPFHGTEAMIRGGRFRRGCTSRSSVPAARRKS